MRVAGVGSLYMYCFVSRQIGLQPGGGGGGGLIAGELITGILRYTGHIPINFCSRFCSVRRHFARLSELIFACLVQNGRKT